MKRQEPGSGMTLPLASSAPIVAMHREPRMALGWVVLLRLGIGAFVLHIAVLARAIET